MPTTLPDRAARARYQRRLLFAKLTPIVAAIFYLLLLVWNMASLETNFSTPFEPDRRQGEYNPMEPSHGTFSGKVASGFPSENATMQK
jgi:hypothetical protein